MCHNVILAIVMIGSLYAAGVRSQSLADAVAAAANAVGSSAGAVAAAAAADAAAAANAPPENRYRPIYKFDGASGGFCYPDYPSSSNDGTCRTTLDQRAPVFVRVDTCGDDTVYTYWLWYGLQQPCIAGPADNGHGNDWERVSVFVRNSQVQKVLFHQHSGQYTRVRGTFESEGERPVVYIGKIAHGSYHAQCDGKCSFDSGSICRQVLDASFGERKQLESAKSSSLRCYMQPCFRSSAVGPVA